MNDGHHKARHVELHLMLDELLADYLRHNRFRRLGDTNLLEFLHWSARQAENPTPSSAEGGPAGDVAVASKHVCHQCPALAEVVCFGRGEVSWFACAAHIKPASISPIEVWEERQRLLQGREGSR